MIELDAIRNYKNIAGATPELERAHEEVKEAIKEINDRHINIAVQLQETALERLVAVDTSTLTPMELLSYLVTAMDIERTSRRMLAEYE